MNYAVKWVQTLLYIYIQSFIKYDLEIQKLSRAINRQTKTEYIYF